MLPLTLHSVQDPSESKELFSGSTHALPLTESASARNMPSKPAWTSKSGHKEPLYEAGPAAEAREPTGKGSSVHIDLPAVRS